MPASDRRARSGPVLVATDGRPAAAPAVALAIRAAERLGAEPQILAVLEPLPLYGTELEGALPPELDAERLAAREHAVRAQVSDVAGPRADLRVDVVMGTPARTIARIAAERSARLVVLGLGRHRTLDRLFGTETALQSLRATRTPVLAVATDAAMLPARAVVAVDFSPASVRAAEQAALLVADGGALRLVHVKPRLELSQPIWEEWDASYGARVEDLFARLVADVRALRPDLEVTFDTRTGDPVDEALAAAHDFGATLVATGTHGGGFFERLFVGSVASGIIRRAACTVLGCPEPSPADAVGLEGRLVGTGESVEPEAWAPILDALTRRSAGRRTRLDVDDPSIGAQAQEHGYAFLGASYDRHDRRVEIMLGDPERLHYHLTRSVPHVDVLALDCTPDGRDRALRLEHDGGRTVLRFEE